MLKNLRRIENCVFNALEKIKYVHQCDVDATIIVRTENKQRILYNLSFPTPAQHIYGSFVISTARVYQDVYAYAYKVFTDILRPYFKK